MSEQDGLEGLEEAMEAFADRVTEEWRTQANLSPLVVRVCTTDTEDTDAQVWDAYAMEFMTLLIGGTLDVSASETLGPDGRQAVQATFVIPDDGLGTKFRNVLAQIAARHGVKPYTSWTEIPARMRLDGW